MRALLVLVLLSVVPGIGAASAASGGDTGKVITPPHLMSMDRVRARFGTPSRKADAIGDPPITRWVYPGYTVYFEHDLVLTGVRHRVQ